MIANDSNKPLTNVCNRNVDNNKGWKFFKMGILMKINNAIIEMNILQQKKTLLKVYTLYFLNIFLEFNIFIEIIRNLNRIR